jgi:uncharacterized protein YndB with AHSA1/START domain
VVSGRCSVRLTRRYSAAPEEVWRALTEKDSLRRWLDPRCDVELRPEASFGLGPEGPGRITGRVRRIEPERLLELDWHAGDDVSVVRFDLRRDGDETVLVLDHELLDERIGMAYLRRWIGALGRLEQEME